MTIEAPQPDSVPDEDVSTVGPITLSPNVPGYPRARGRGPGWILPTSDYALPNTYVEPFMFPMAARQPNYPLDLVGPGNFKRQHRSVDIRQYIHHDDEYGGGGGLYVGENEFGDDYDDGLSGTAEDAVAQALAQAQAASAQASSGSPSTPSVSTTGESIVGALSAIVTAGAAGAQQLYSTYQQGRTALKDARAMNEPGPRIPGVYQRQAPSSDGGGGLKLAVLAGVGVLAVLLLVGGKKQK